MQSSKEECFGGKENSVAGVELQAGYSRRKKQNVLHGSVDEETKRMYVVQTSRRLHLETLR